MKEIKLEFDLPKQHLQWSQRKWSFCQSDDDGYCEWYKCPQNYDGEPKKTGRHCPLDLLCKEEDI